MFLKLNEHNTIWNNFNKVQRFWIVNIFIFKIISTFQTRLGVSTNYNTFFYHSMWNSHSLKCVLHCQSAYFLPCFPATSIWIFIHVRLHYAPLSKLTLLWPFPLSASAFRYHDYLSVKMYHSLIVISKRQNKGSATWQLVMQKTV